MPNNDLGTAHGRIQIEFEDNGTKKAVTAIERMQRELELLNRRMASMEKSFTAVDRSVSKSAQSFTRARKESSGFFFELIGGSRIVKAFDRDIVDLIQDLTTLNKKINETRQKYVVFEKAYKAIDRFAKTNATAPVDALARALTRLHLGPLANTETRLRTFNRALDSVGWGLKATTDKVWKFIYGYNEAMASLPQWTKQVIGLSAGLGTLAAAGLRVGKVLQAGFIVKFLDSNVFQKLVKGSLAASAALHRFGDRTHRIFRRPLFAGLAFSFFKAEGTITKGIHRLSSKLNAGSVAFNRWFKPIAQAARHIEHFTLGIGLMGSGFANLAAKLSWLSKIPRPLLIALATTISNILPAAFQVFAKALVTTSNILNGLWMGIKQLSGGLLTLPGLLANIGVVAGTLKSIFAGVADQFKDIFSNDPEEFAEAWAKLPEHLKPMAKALKEVVDKFKEGQVDLQKIAFKDIEHQIRSLGEKYLPLLKNGMEGLTLSFRNAKDELVKFFEEAQTQKDMRNLFADTTQIINNLKQGLQPVADAFRDIAMVGSTFFTDMSVGFGGLATKFAQWARTNRENGAMLAWMQNARKGMRDLTLGTINLTKGLFKIITVFKNNDGSTFLEQYAKQMERFNLAMKKSAGGGFLFDIANWAKSFAFGREKIETFLKVWGSFTQMMEGVAPLLVTISNTFSGMFIPALQDSMEMLGKMAKVASALKLDVLTGIILGLVGVFKLLPNVLGPVFNAVRVVGGAILTISSAKGTFLAMEKGVSAFAKSLEKIPFVGTKASDSVKRVAASMRNAMAITAAWVGPITAVALALGALWAITSTTKSNIAAFDKQLNENATTLTNFGKALHGAFMADNGLIGSTVMDQVSMGMDNMLRDLENTAELAPGIIDHIGDKLQGSNPFAQLNNLIQHPTGMFRSDSVELNQRQAEAEAADMAAQKLRELRKAGIDLEARVAGSRGAFDTYIIQLRNQGKEGQAAADVLIKQRNVYEQVRDSIQKIGPAGVALAEGLKKVAEAGGDATTRLEGLRSVLKGLGFLKVDALEAAAAYTTTLGEMGDRIRDVIESGGSLNDVWDQATNTLNTQSQLGAKLVPVFKEISAAYLDAANSGENIDSLTRRLNNELENLAGSLKTTPEKLKEFFRNNLGVAPDAIKLTLGLEGKEDFVRKVGELILQVQRQVETGMPIQIPFSTLDAADNFDKALEDLLGHDITDQDGLNVVIKPGIKINEADLAAFQQLLAAHGIQLGDGPVVDPAKIPVAVNPPTAPLPPVGPRQVSDQPAWLPQTPPQRFTPPDPIAPPSTPDPPNLQPAIQDTDELDGKMHKLFSEDHQIKVNSDKLTEIGTQVDELEKKFSEKKLKATVEVDGEDKIQNVLSTTQKVAESLSGVFTAFKEKLEEASRQLAGKIEEISNAITSTIEKTTDTARSAGSKFVDAFASGMRSNPSAIQAAESMAEDVMKRFHRSPPQKGPLAQHGDAAKYGGEQFVSSYSTGMRDSAPRVATAANAVAGAAAGAVSGGGAGAGAGQFLGQLLEMVNFASALNEIFTRVSESFMQLAKFMSDPLGKGTFFGNSAGFSKTVSDEALRRRKEDEEQRQYTDSLDNGRRNLDDFNARLETITNAQNAVADSDGLKSREDVKSVGQLIKENFPEIAVIGGARQDSKPFHTEGRALDVMIPDYNTPEGKALGDRINAFMLQNAEKLGIDYTIWQDYYQPTKLGGGGKGNFMGNADPTQGHFDHLHINFAPGSAADLTGIELTPEELKDYNEKSAKEARRRALEELQNTYGPPSIDGVDIPNTEPQPTIRLDKDGNYELVTPHGKSSLPGPGSINPETDKPYTQQESLDIAKRNPMEFALPEGMDVERFNEILNDPNFNGQNSEETMNRVSSSNEDIARALQMMENPQAYGGAEIQNSLIAIDNEVARLREIDTPASRQTASRLETVQSSIMDDTGYTRNENPIDTISGMIGNAAGVASDIIGSVITGIEAAGAADNIAKTLVRGVEDTESVSNIIDNVQKFIELGAKISGSVASVSGLIGSMVGAGASSDPSGGAGSAAAAIQAVSTIASLVQAGYETANAVIDLTQEAFRIAGSYFGDFLGYLVGGPGGPLNGDVKFLLDQQTNQLLTYSSDNPLDKRIHNIPFTAHDETSRQQMIGNINVYGGPGSDPRDLTRQMMFQVNSAQYAGALSQ